MPTDVAKIPVVSLIAGKEFRNWVIKDLDPFSQAVRNVKKRCRNIELSFSQDSVTTAPLKTNNVHLDIGAQRARDQMSRDQQGRPKNKRKEGIRRRERTKMDWTLRESLTVEIAKEQLHGGFRASELTRLGVELPRVNV
ncbi:uncharacterized protein TNCV_1931881 [Trichonephila clavipes]|nr:uncharacterized protein TNCV_1931881 [Trichonephila clavipes]